MLYENFPFKYLIISISLQLFIYAIGAYIVSLLGYLWLIIYLILILSLEFRILKKSCVNCYYYGKYCSFGRGKLCSIFFKKSTKKFCDKKITWKDILPDFLISLIPTIIGIVLLIINFNWLLLILIIILLFLTSFGNGFVRSSISCKYCKQKELGCPAEKLFQKKQKD